jgi:hypothetical protein
LRIENLTKDLADGILLVNLIEIISGKSLGRYNKHPRVPFQKLENNTIALNFLKTEGIKLVNISAEDLCDCREKLILGLIWTLILRYQINKGGNDSGAKNELLEWVRSKIPEYNIQNFQKDWNDGKAICALVNALDPGCCSNHASLNPQNALDNASKGIDLAFNNIGCPKLILAEEMIHPKVDELAMMTYISYLRDLSLSNAPKTNWAGKCRAYGQGLVEGIQNELSEFCVELPDGCPSNKQLKVKVIGPKDSAEVKIVKNGNNYKVSYTPKTPGKYEVHVTLDEDHIPGSIFYVNVLEEESLGGEGKIRIFYSTTSAKDEKTRPLQEMLMKKGVHLRPEFEPWIPVDIMEPKDRDAVFRKAQTKILPIVYIDDKYIGDYAKVMQMGENGELDKLLRFNEKDAQNVSSFLQTYKAPEAPKKAASKASAPVLFKTDVSSDKPKEKGVCSKCGVRPTDPKAKFLSIVRRYPQIDNLIALFFNLKKKTISSPLCFFKH